MFTVSWLTYVITTPLQMMKEMMRLTFRMMREVKLMRRVKNTDELKCIVFASSVI